MVPAINPKWTKLAHVRSIEEALKKYYKPDRLPGDLSGLTAYARRWLDEEGVTILASRHESVTGRARWILELDDGAGFEIYQSDK